MRTKIRDMWRYTWA